MACTTCFILFVLVYVAYVTAENKRILLSDPDFTNHQLQSIQATIQDLQSKLALYQNDLSVTKSHLASQGLKQTMQENKILQQEQTITALENKLLQQEHNITEQQKKILLQESTLTTITNNLTQVLLHNFVDEMAQAMCSADTNLHSYVYALRRDCAGGKGHAPTCTDICAAAASQMSGDPSYKNVQCYDAFHIQKNHKHLVENPSDLQPDAGKPFMSVFRYQSAGCTFRADICGPNYCCCRASH